MDVMSYSDARANLKTVMDQVTANKEEIVITRSKGEPVVMVSLDCWRSQQETNHLLSTAANASRLLDSIAELDAGGGTERDIIET
jgi:antitoxin YefM